MTEKTLMELGVALSDLRHAIRRRAIIESSPEAEHKHRMDQIDSECRIGCLESKVRHLHEARAIVAEGLARTQAIQNYLQAMPSGLGRLG